MSTIPVKALDSGFAMPVYGMGTWGMGGRIHHDSGNDDAADLRAIRNAIDAGVTHFDSAESYAEGYAETLLGRAIEHADHASLFIVTKVSQGHQRPDDLQRSFEGSYARLGTDYLDLYMLHRWDSSVPIGETMDALCQLVDEGRVRNIAVSNFTVERMEQAQAVSRHKIVANQLHYNLQVREVERVGLLDHCQKNDVMLIAWRPVQKGHLSLDDPTVKELAERYRKTPTQIAINWLVSQPAVVTLAKTRSVEHLHENLGACDWTMELADIERLRTQMSGQVDRSDTVPLDYL